MLRLPTSLTIMLCFVSYAMLAQAQVPDQQIKTWIKDLSVKLDQKNKKFDGIRDAINAMDSIQHCQVLERIYQASKEENIRCQIRGAFLYYNTTCLPAGRDLNLLKNALQKAYEIEDEPLQFQIHLTIGQIYNGLAQYGLASLHFRQYFEIINQNNRSDLYLPSGAYYDMSFSLYHTQEYENCIRTGLNALFALPNAQFQPDDTLNTYQQMQSWNTMGLAYQKLKQPEKAFDAFSKAESIAKILNSNIWKGIIKGNKGDVYYDLGRYDSAYALLQFDYEQSLKYNEFDNAANSLQWMARIDLRNGHAMTGLEKLHTAKQLLYQQPQPAYLANVEYALTQVYAALGRPDSLNYSLEHYLHLHDSIETEITRSRTDILQMQLNNLDQIQTIKMLNRQKKQIALTRNSTIIIVVLMGCIVYLLMSRRVQKMNIRQQEALQAKRKAESEADQAKLQLDFFRQNLLEKNAQIEQWQSDQASKETSEEHQRRISELTHHLILKEEDWQQFKVLFDSVYPGFFNSLRHKVPDITQAEQRMAALIKLKLTVKEAANLLGVSTNTVYTTRRRLRQRLGLDIDSDLDP